MNQSNHAMLILFSMVAAAQHLTWSAAMFSDESATLCTPISHTMKLFRSSQVLACCYGAAGLLGLMSAFLPWHRFFPWPWDRMACVLSVLPQQIMLLLSAWGEGTAIWKSEFADGVVRAREFIGSDQCLGIYFAIAHGIALLWVFGGGDFLKHGFNRRTGD